MVQRQAVFIHLLMPFSGKLFPLIFRPHILEVERSVSSGTLRCEQSHHEEVPGWRARYKIGVGGQWWVLPAKPGTRPGGLFLLCYFFFFFLFQTFWLEESSVVGAEDTQPPRALPKAFQVQPPQTDRWTHTAPCARQG